MVQILMNGKPVAAHILTTYSISLGDRMDTSGHYWSRAIQRWRLRPRGLKRVMIVLPIWPKISSTSRLTKEKA